MGTIMVDMIDARETDGFVAVATQGNGIYSTNYNPSFSVGESPKNQLVKLRNYPNPFQNQTTIEYELSHGGNVDLNLLDMNGKMVKHLFTGQKQQGTHTLLFNGSELRQGIYLIKLVSGNNISYHKIILSKLLK
jgi:hypothetical protein